MKTVKEIKELLSKARTKSLEAKVKYEQAPNEKESNRCENEEYYWEGAMVALETVLNK